eukprot:6198323-Pleurochrysis_carterae.AAC.3
MSDHMQSGNHFGGLDVCRSTDVSLGLGLNPLCRRRSQCAGARPTSPASRARSWSRCAPTRRGAASSRCLRCAQTRLPPRRARSRRAARSR